MSFKPKYYIVYPHGLENQIKWPSNWGNTCRANLSSMLREVLNVSTIGSEIKLIWNEQHRMEVMREHNVTYTQLEDYLHANCSILSFRAIGTRNRAVKALKRMGGCNFILVGSYRDVILYQACFKRHGKFPPERIKDQYREVLQLGLNKSRKEREGKVHWTSLPWNSEGCSVATDRYKKMVVTPEIEGYEDWELNLRTTTEDCPESLLSTTRDKIIDHPSRKNREISVRDLKSRIDSIDFNELKQKKTCHYCQGSGKVEWHHRGYTKEDTCPKCKGSCEIIIGDKGFHIVNIGDLMVEATLLKDVVLPATEILEVDTITWVSVDEPHGGPLLFTLGSVQIAIAACYQYTLNDIVVFDIEDCLVKKSEEEE